mmetsp:Transcript_233/g.569  ORF Transcript_233/g.569 Transcript_233/m.569 type:complete len:240 (+) Transcript_233:62-781(+)
MTRSSTTTNRTVYPTAVSDLDDKPMQTEDSIDTNYFAFAHDALRGELQDFRRALEHIMSGSHVDKKRTPKATKRWWRGHYRHVQSYLRSQARIVKSIIVGERTRCPESEEADHKNITSHLDTIEHQVETLIATPSLLSIRSLYNAWLGYSLDLTSYMEAKETFLQSHTGASASPVSIDFILNGQTGSVMHYVGSDTLRAQMETQDIPPVLAKLYDAVIFQPRHRMYERTMLKNLRTISE